VAILLAADQPPTTDGMPLNCAGLLAAACANNCYDALAESRRIGREG
jgi:hypothetical protein